MLCNGSHWGQPDSVALVLWFKGSQSEPIYTVDARLAPSKQANSTPNKQSAGEQMPGARHHIADSYRGRAKFVSAATPPYLDLAQLEPEDQAEYRCRLDYRSKPRENFLAILFVIGEFLRKNIDHLLLAQKCASCRICDCDCDFDFDCNAPSGFVAREARFWCKLQLARPFAQITQAFIYPTL